MKKNNRQDFRRETIELIKKLNLSDVSIADKLRTSVRTINRWRTGFSSPQPSQFAALKNLVTGEPKQEQSHVSGNFESLILGRLDQLTRQIADLQAEFGAVKENNRLYRETFENKLASMTADIEILQAADAKKKDGVPTDTKKPD